MTLHARLRHRLGTTQLDLELAAGAGRITAVFGPSGAGKSSLLAAVAGLITPDAGQITLAGVTLFDSAARINLPPHRRRVAVMFQDVRLFPHLSVAGNLRYGWRRAGRPGGSAAIDAMTQRLGLAPLLGRRPATLSGGEKQRVALARALLAGPACLLLDEPMAALDETLKGQAAADIAGVRAATGIPVVLVSHSLREVALLADDIVLVDAGRIVARRTIDDLAELSQHLPAALRDEAGGVLHAHVVGTDAAGRVTELACDGARFGLPLPHAAPVGSRIRLRVAARDVLLATRRPEAISASIVLPGIVRAIRRDEHACDVTFDVASGGRLLARITPASVERLALAPGSAVWAVIKAVALHGAATTPPRGA